MVIREFSSKRDDSVNLVIPAEDGGYFEARYVRRVDDYFAVYLSSQSGCRQACRMCHLTHTKQTTDLCATDLEFVQQAQAVYNKYDISGRTALRVHYNFMARGEPLCNANLDDRLLQLLSQLAEVRGLIPRYLISTIMPKTFEPEMLFQRFPTYQPEIYYSLYSFDPEFRKKWLPNAMDPDKALDHLAVYQQATRRLLKLHWALIRGENDYEEDIEAVVAAVVTRGLRVDFNLVHYNPPSAKHGRESAHIQEYAELLSSKLPTSHVQIVPRVGFDVKASCGMFVDKKSLKNGSKSTRVSSVS